jgi:hypothetical protein
VGETSKQSYRFDAVSRSGAVVPVTRRVKSTRAKMLRNKATDLVQNKGTRWTMLGNKATVSTAFSRTRREEAPLGWCLPDDIATEPGGPTKSSWQSSRSQRLFFTARPVLNCSRTGDEKTDLPPLPSAG